MKYVDQQLLSMCRELSFPCQTYELPGNCILLCIEHNKSKTRVYGTMELLFNKERINLHTIHNSQKP